MHAQQPARVSTGIDGLDDILGGGLPRGHLYLLQGHPGVGKTTLALQFLLAGARAGETSLYITLSESAQELRDVAASHGWSLEGLSVFEFKPGAFSESDDDYTVFHPAEVELREAMKTLLDEVERVQPSRVVFDSLSEVRLLSQHALRYRRQILALKQHFVGSSRTVLLLDDLTADVGDGQLESLAHGVVALERTTPAYGSERRRVRVAKLRGARFRGGYHDFDLQTGGLRVFPRLVAAEHLTNKPQGPAPSGVEALDALLGGGIHRGTSTLLMGPAGAGKSVIATQLVVAAAERGERAAMFIFDESDLTLTTRAEALGMKFRRHVDAGTVQIRQVDPAEMSPGELAYEVRMAVERDHVRVVVIDSLNGYLHAMPEENFLVVQLHELLTYLGQQGVATILVAAQHGLLGAAMAAPVDVTYLADTVVLMRYFEAGGRVRNAVSVVKKRSGTHERTIREFSLGSEGVTIGNALTEFEGVLTGVPRYVGAKEPLIGAGDERAGR